METQTIPQVDFKLDEVLDERGISGKALSDMSGLSQGAISDLRTGKNSLPRRETLARICHALKVTPGDLIKLV